MSQHLGQTPILSIEHRNANRMLRFHRNQLIYGRLVRQPPSLAFLQCPGVDPESTYDLTGITILHALTNTEKGGVHTASNDNGDCSSLLSQSQTIC